MTRGSTTSPSRHRRRQRRRHRHVRSVACDTRAMVMAIVGVMAVWMLVAVIVGL
jgi:hypothetical protein